MLIPEGRPAFLASGTSFRFSNRRHDMLKSEVCVLEGEIKKVWYGTVDLLFRKSFFFVSSI